MTEQEALIFQMACAISNRMFRRELRGDPPLPPYRKHGKERPGPKARKEHR